MKKILALVISLALLCPAAVFSAGEENVTEKLSGIWLSPEQNADVLATMQEECNRIIEELITKYLGAPVFARRKLGFSDDDEEMKRQVNEMYCLKDEILKVYYVEENKYAKAYADSNVFRYLISDDYYWYMDMGGIYDRFESDGHEYVRTTDTKTTPIGRWVIDEAGIEFLQNEEKILAALDSIDLNQIRDIKYVVVDINCACLYIDCGSNEYLMRVFMGSYTDPNDVHHSLKWVDELELYQLYDAKEFFNTISTTMNVMNTAKPTYETEAAALQSEGLLLGNENGLDLLKPLSRVEAATMLLRAMGESTESTAQAQTFVDVPATHWGYGAAENAYSLGIVNGMGDDRFAPDENVTAVQFATMLLRAGEHEEFNWEEAVNIMVEGGVITQEEASTMDFFTRGDMAKMLYEAREKGMIG